MRGHPCMWRPPTEGERRVAQQSAAIEAALESTDGEQATAIAKVAFCSGQDQLPPTQDAGA